MHLPMGVRFERKQEISGETEVSELLIFPAEILLKF